ncbi:dimethylsulfone monooxygenase SfnG [Hyphomicrobium sp.]|uniref:dimethylsulfone monooxygenase SfnG n=1 Tax=Hyphomicrobium sp. TaxID=82 RepID=UPI001D9A800C|nr:dimethyl sulfone monooxygenase SfnG [Hyphomicrobium sp.]MBY0558530.1 dimethyl sulfone monooxygenase SfnG [Hyphomicrobium sp.]
MQFAYWNTNLGSVLFSSIPQKADPDLAFQLDVARRAEEAGFDYTLVAARFVSTAGSSPDMYDALAASSALVSATRRLNVIAALHPGLWHPAMVAKFAATLSLLSQGRFHINVVSGWFKDEFVRLGETWLDHDERYRRSDEFISVLRGLTSGEPYSFSGDFFRIRELTFKPKPQHPIDVFQGGNSLAARNLAARRADWYFMNGDTIDGITAQIAEVRKLAEPLGRKPKFAVNAFVILRDTESEAVGVLDEIIARADSASVQSFREHAQGAGSSTKDRVGMWANSSLAHLVQPNDGFKTGLIGTPERLIEQIRALEAAGVDLVLCGFLDFLEEPTVFGHAVIDVLKHENENHRA